jgi:phosphomannomutase
VTIFRAYDIRGIYPTELNEVIAERIGRAFGSYVKGSAVSLGRDTRKSGPELEKAFLKGVLSTGTEVHSYGIIPIAILSFMTMKESRSGAAYISASHNPPEYNGVRFRTKEGYGLLYKDSSIIKFYDIGDFLTTKQQGTLINRDPGMAIEAYRDFVGKKLSIKRKLKVVLDTGNGSSGIIGPLYTGLGLDVKIINGSLDGGFPGRGPAPNEKSLEGASRAVVESEADFGVGFDPDADRGILIDERGGILPPEKVAVILARERYKAQDLIISGFDCSMMLERQLEPDGIRVARERVGDVYVANRVKNEGAVLGVERSGHFFLPEFQYSDDPFAMSLAIAEIISKGEKLSELAAAIPDYPYVQRSIKLPPSIQTSIVMERLEGQLASMELDRTDGLKIIAKDHTALIRPSNTEPLLRLYVETTGNDPLDPAARYEQLIRESIS